MRRALVLLVLASLAPLGCTSNKGDIHEVRRPAPPPPPRQLRFELVETACVETGAKVELWVPLASSEPGVQEIERLDVKIRPDTPYDVTSDSRGNRVLHLECAAPVSVSVTYRVLRTEVAPGPSPEHLRPLTDGEKRMFAAELAELTAPSSPVEAVPEGSNSRELATAIAETRRRGSPARVVMGFEIGREGTVNGSWWIERYEPGRAWVPYLIEVLYGYHFKGKDPGPVLGAEYLIVSHGADHMLPYAHVDSADAWPRTTFKTRLLDSP